MSALMNALRILRTTAILSCSATSPRLKRIAQRHATPVGSVPALGHIVLYLRSLGRTFRLAVTLAFVGRRIRTSSDGVLRARVPAQHVSQAPGVRTRMAGRSNPLCQNRVSSTA